MDIKILIVEDDHTQNDVLANFLRNESYEVQSAYTLEEARQLLNDRTSLMVLDVMLPDGNGLTFLKEVREYSNIPVIVLTALDDEYTQVSTFDLKADEYVDKPVSPIIMTKRIKALIERIYISSKVVEIQNFIFDFDKYKVFTSRQEEIKFTTKEISIIKLLYDNKGRVVTRDNLLDGIWGYEYSNTDRLVDTHIKNIRKKLCADIIITIKNVGYRLNI